MRIRIRAWAVGNTLVAPAAVAAVTMSFAFALTGAACSSGSTGGAPPAPAPDSGSAHDSGSASSSGGGSGSGSGGGVADDAGDTSDAASCGSTPHLHAGDGGSVYCPFGPDGGSLDCPTGSTVCCVGGTISTGNYAVSQCGTPSETCPNPLPDAGKYPARRIECEESIDCAGSGMVCCATGGVPAMDPACNYYRESPGLTAATCTTGACPAGQFQICASDTECGSGHTCAAFKAIGIQLGFCQ
jgi:hypothetical protein